MKRRFLREQGGFTLPEMLVSITMMIVVLLALYSVFDMSIRVFGIGNDKVEATENARLGLDKMAREIRSAYPYDKINGQRHLFWNSASPTTGEFPPDPSSVTFGNDRNGNRKIDVSTEQITYAVSGTTLQRNGEPAVEFVQDTDGDGTALSFEYFDANGTEIFANEANIAMIRITLEISVRRGGQAQPVTQVLQTNVALRNRGEQ